MAPRNWENYRRRRQSDLSKRRLADGWGRARPEIEWFGTPGIIMTAGVNPAGLEVGYSDGSLLAPFGSLTRSPVADEAMTVFVTFESAGAVYLQVFFAGDLTGELAGLPIWVDGVPYTIFGQWTYHEGIGTTATVQGFPFMFEDGGTYQIDVRAVDEGGTPEEV